MNRKTFFGTLIGLSFLGTIKAFAKEKVRRLIQDYAGDTLQVRRLEIVDEKGIPCGFIEERDGKLSLGTIARAEPQKKTEQVRLQFQYQEPSRDISFLP